MSAPTINRLAVVGLKVDALELSLGRLNLLLGPVGAGKSSAHDAVQFAGLGYVARVGLAAAQTAKLMRGDRAEVALGFAFNGEQQSVTRRLYRDGAKLVGDAVASWLPPRTLPTEAGDKIRQLFGATEAEAAQNLDVARLLSAPAGELAAAVEKLLDGAGLDADAVEREAVRIFRGRIETLRPNRDGILGDLPAEVARLVAAVLPTLVDRARRSLADAAIYFRDQKNAAAAEAKQARAAAKEATARLAEISAPAEASTELRRRREEAAARKREVDAALRTFRAAAAARTAADAAVEKARRDADLALEALQVRKDAAAKAPELRAQADAAALPAPPAGPVFHAVDQAAMDAETKPLHARLETLQAPTLPTPLDLIDASDPAAAAAFDPPTAAALKQARANQAEAQAAYQAHIATGKPTVSDIEDVEIAFERAERDLANAQQQPWREVERIADGIDSEFGVDGRDLSYSKRLRALAKENGGDYHALRAALARAREAFEQAKMTRDGELAASDEWHKTRERLGKAVDAAAAAASKAEIALGYSVRAENARRTAANAEAAKEYREARTAFETERANIAAEISAVERRYRDAADAANARAREDHARRMATWRDEVAKVEASRSAARAEAERLEQQLRISERIERETRAAYETARAARDAAAGAVAIDEPAAVAETESLAMQIADLDGRIGAVERHEALRDELARVEQKGEASEYAREVYAAAEFALGRVRDEDLRARAGALEEPMRRFLATIPDAGEPMVRAEKGKVQLGLRYADRFVDASALSGGQSALFRAGLGYAVLMARKPILRVLHIELAEACDGVLEDQILRACEAVSHEVQVIVTTCVPISAPEEGRGWNVVRLEAAAHA